MHTADVEGPLFLRRFGVPFWALARVFGRNPMFWYRLECGLGRSSVVGTTARQGAMPEHLLADEHHQSLNRDFDHGQHLHGSRPACRWHCRATVDSCQVGVFLA